MRSWTASLPLLCLLLTACSSGRVVVTSDGKADSPREIHTVKGPVASLGIPPGHYPPPGQCRVWLPGTPPGHQPAPVRLQHLDPERSARCVGCFTAPSTIGRSSRSLVTTSSSPPSSSP